MSKSRETGNKKEIESKKQKRKKDKEQRRQERKAHAQEETSFDDMIAYVDEYGNITSTPPDPAKKEEIKKEDIEVSVPKQEGEQQATTGKRGRVKFFNDDKGYGFINEEGSQESVFVHVSGLVDKIRENDRVTFEITQGPKGPVAVNVKVVQ